MASVVYKGSEGGAAPKTNQDAAKQRVANEALNKLNSTTTKDISSAAVAAGAPKPATSTASKTNTIAMSNDFSGAFKPSTTPSGTGSGKSVNPDSAASHNGDTAKPDVIYDDNWLNGVYYGPSGSGSTPSGNGTQTVEEAATTEPEKSQEEQLRDAWAAAGEVTKRLVEGATPEDIDISAIDKVDVNELESKLEQIRQIQEQRATGQIDYAVEQGVNDVNRAVEDAAPQFQTQRNQISADEQRALDNQVLYAEARGDRGGIGQSQYASIQNNAATNRYKVNQKQTKLATDAARQIADLRAKGEFEKADSLLQISQNYLSELNALEQWALQTNLGVDEFNKQLEQWEANYNMSRDQFLINAEMSAASMTGAFSDGTPTLTARDKVEAQLANAAQALFQLSLPLTDEQIAALGWTKGQYTQYMNEQAVAKAAGGSGGGGYSGAYYGGSGDEDIKAIQRMLNESGYSLDVDGIYGPKTEAALAEYDRLYGNNNVGANGSASEASLAAAFDNEAKISATSNAGTGKATGGSPRSTPYTPMTLPDLGFYA